MRLILVFVGLLVFVSVTLLNLHLLYLKFVSGGEFSVILIAFAVISLLIPLLPEVQNFSIAGNSVTFKEVKKEAEDAILELKQSQIDTMSMLLLAVTKSSGMKTLDSVFLESENFWKLYEKIVQNSIERQLCIDILAVLDDLMKSYVFLFVNSSEDASKAFSYEEALLPETSRLLEVIYDDNNITHKDLVTKGLLDYQRLYDLKDSLNKKI
ncbi:hypothetical protein AB6D92_05180 [Vibrio splendidus]